MSDDILIVDDNALNLELLTFILTASGYGVRSAANADEAIAAIERSPPRLVLMDLQMPGMSGLELTRRLKAAPATRAIPIIAVTAYAMQGDEAKARAAGCDDYVTKPIDRVLLRQLVARHLGR